MNTDPDTTTVALRAAALIGRQAEYARLREALVSAANGRVTVAFLVGDPGIGKTRLLDAVAAQGAADGWAVLRGGAFEAEGMPPYLPFLQALGGYIRTAPVEQLRIEAAAIAPTLATIMPEIVTRLGASPAAHPPVPGDDAYVVPVVTSSAR